MKTTTKIIIISLGLLLILSFFSPLILLKTLPDSARESSGAEIIEEITVEKSEV